jgi:hypothetical protein
LKRVGISIITFVGLLTLLIIASALVLPVHRRVHAPWQVKGGSALRAGPVGTPAATPEASSAVPTSINGPIAPVCPVFPKPVSVTADWGPLKKTKKNNNKQNTGTGSSVPTAAKSVSAAEAPEPSDASPVPKSHKIHKCPHENIKKN